MSARVPEKGPWRSLFGFVKTRSDLENWRAQTAGRAFVRDGERIPGAEILDGSVVRHSGGDCEDLNLLFAGSVWFEHAVGSVYYPDVRNARHVALVVELHGSRYVVDLVARTVQVWRGHGELVEWK